MEILGFVGALLMGVSLGLLGAGGSILCVPLLIYFHGMNASDAAAHSLLIVGVSALIASLGYYRRKEIDLHHGIVFGVPSLVTIFLTRKYFMPVVPSVVFGFQKDLLLLVLFSVLMIMASLSMIRKQRTVSSHRPFDLLQKMKVAFRGIYIGFLSGVVGVGGGFLIIPVLVVMAGLPMKVAVGTSLALITVNSLVGFGAGIGHHDIHWSLLLIYILLSLVGIAIGGKVSGKFSGEKLKPAFGWFVLVLGLFILAQQIHGSFA